MCFQLDFDKCVLIGHLYNFHEFCPQVVNNNLNPTWKPFRITLQSLCGGDMDKPIKVIAFLT